MQIELGADIRTQDDHDAGVIKHLILDPQSEQVKTVVIEKGLILHDDVEVPLSALRVLAPDRIEVECTADELKRLPRFDETLYTAVPPQEWVPWGNYLPGGLLWPSAYPVGTYPGGWGVVPPMVFTPSPPGDDEVEALRQHRDRENAVIEAGDDVFSQDGEMVGTIHSMTIDAETTRPVRLVISRGAIFPTHVELPPDLIESIDDGAVTLNLTKAQIEELSRVPHAVST